MHTNQTTTADRPTVSWYNEDGYDFPSVDLGDIVWEAWHSVDPDNPWVDGRVLDADGNVLANVDVVAIMADDAEFVLGDLAIYDFDLEATRQAAQRAWDTGTVHTLDTDPTYTVLVAPTASLHDGDVIAAALERSRP